MGWIERIELENFKSYKGSHIIGPFKQFTSVIGPNGSGKSNLMDAICFVLGMDTRRLRSSNVKELIYRGPKETKPVTKRKSYVTLVYKSDRDTEQQFTRSIATNGSVYQIDGKTVAFESYNKDLEDMGVIVSARNFLVFQGDVESVAAKSPKELTAFIEKVAGSEQYKKDYEAARIEMEKAMEDAVFAVSKRKTINAERKQYKEQKEEAERYHQLQKDLAEAKKKFSLFELYHIDRDMKVQSKEAEQDKTTSENLEARKASIQTELTQKKKDQAIAHNEVVKLEKKIAKRRSDFEKGRPNIIALKEEIDHLTKKLKSSKESVKKSQHAYDVQQNDVKVLRKELERLQAELDKITQQEEQQGDKLSISKEHLEEYARIKESVGVKTAEPRKEREALERKIALEQEELSRMNQRKEELNKRITQLKDNQVQMQERKARVQELVGSTKSKLDSLKARAHQREKEVAEAKKLQEELNEELTQIQGQLQEAKTERRDSDRDKRFTTALESMQRLFPGVRGRLLDLCQSTTQKYDLAITVAMGKYMDAVVVDDDKTARDCVQYMKEQRIGTATFLPIESLKTKPINEKLRELPGAKLVVDLLKFDASVQNAITFVVGNTLVAESLNDARRLAFNQADRHRVVTTKGVLIQKSGLLSGSAGGSAEARAFRWDEKRVDGLKKQREKITQQLTTIARELKVSHQPQSISSSAVSEDVQEVSLASKLEYGKTDLAWTEERLEKISKDLENANGDLKELGPAITAVEKRIADLQQQAAVRTQTIHKVEDDLFKAFCTKAGVSSIRQYEEERLSTIQERTKRKVELTKHISILNSQIEYENGRDTAVPLTKLKDAIKADEERLTNLQAQHKQYESEDKEFQKELDEILGQQNRAKATVDELDISIKEIKKQLAAVEKEIGTVQKKLAVAETQLLQLRTRRHALYRQARVEEIRLPLKKKSKHKSPKKGKSKGKKRAREEKEGEEESEEEEAEDEAEKEVDWADYEEEITDSANSESTQVVQSLTAEDKIELDFSGVEKTTSTKEYEDKKAQQLRQMQDIEAEMVKLAPNMKAVERLDDVDSKLKDATEEIENIRTRANTAETKFNKIKDDRRTAFMKAFDAISANISVIYEELTRSPQHPNLHGAAYMHVENTHEPYLEGVKYTTMPLMKRFREMEQLSGGEKTVAALALLFAAHKFRPSPFFILDEVDAALDPSNVQLVARYIRKQAVAHPVQCQFIVISLKDAFFDKSLSLVGICRDAKESSSKPFTLDLTPYKE